LAWETFFFNQVFLVGVF